MTNLTTCKSCGKEVAKSAKSCPHCGAKLKMGMGLKLLIGLAILVAIVTFVVPSTDKDKARADHLLSLQEMALQKPADLSPNGELAEMYNLGSDFTDLQRDAKEKELAGKIVEWKLPIYEVGIRDKERKIYKVQTSSQGGVVGAFVYIHAMDDEDERILLAMKTDNMLHFKGKIKDVSMRSINIDPAVLVRNRGGTSQDKEQDQVASNAETQLIATLTLAKEKNDRNDSGKILQIFKNGGFIDNKPEARMEYSDYYLFKKSANFLGHELILIQDEYMDVNIGCCVNPGLVVYVRLSEDVKNIENFANINNCLFGKNLDMQDLFNSLSLKIKLKPGSYGAIDCRESSLPSKD